MPLAQPTSVTDHNRALALFTDRMGARRRFLEYLHADQPPERLLFFHGDGGNGKSLLLRLLATRYCRRLDPADWQPLAALANDRACVEGYDALARSGECGRVVPHVYHDLASPGTGTEDPRGDWSGPLMIRRELGRQGLKLPLFDFAAMSFMHKAGMLDPARIKSLFPNDEADLANGLYELIAHPDLPVVGLALKVLKLFGAHFQTDLALRWASRGLDDERLRVLRTLDPRAELGPALPALLGESIDTAMQSPKAPPRLVLLIDTHESFWGTARHAESDAGYFLRDQWLRELLAQLYRPNHGVIVVLAGREPPRWPDALTTPIPADLIDTQLIGHLDPTDAADSLRRALPPVPGRDPAAERALHAAIVRYTEVEPGQVHPFYLGLAADLVLQANASGRPLTPADFAPASAADRPAIGRRLTERMLRWCPPEIQAAVTALAAARRFDRGLYRKLGQRRNFHCTEAAFATLTGFSFVWRDRQPDRAATPELGPEPRPEYDSYRIHDLLRRLIADLAPGETLKAHAALESIHRDLAAGRAESMAEAIYHANRQDWERGYLEWCEVMNQALANARYALAEALAGLWPMLSLETPFAAANVALDVGELALALARHPTADTALREAVLGFDRQLAQTPDDVASQNKKGRALASVGKVRATLSDHGGAECAYNEAIAAYSEALTRAPDDIAVHINKGSALLGLGALRAALSDHAGAEAAYADAIAAYGEALRRVPDHVLAHMNKGSALLRLGELRAAVSDRVGAESAFADAIAALGEALRRAPDQVAAHNNKGLALAGLGALRAALSDHAVAESAYADAIAAYGEALRRAPDYVLAYMNKGNALASLGDLHRARDDRASESAYTAAIAAIDEALDRAPDHVLALGNKGRHLRKLAELYLDQANPAACQRLHEAKSLLDRALTLAPNHRAITAESGRVERLLAAHCPPP